ncbi:intraflagellar transport protein 25 homolog [Pecten maximus]|uniref:intraflagellar transport protein 25 homolog n=1 Tax=Pecten maximus TaxID=6579 RepID=UPI0014587882|nr:intraflagellar transport protein 25 homolog [Pecten maximus]
MFDVALRSAGAGVVLATSSDDNYPPENMIDGDTQTFWSSTGMFPQEFIITFTSVVNIARIELCCSNVKNVIFEKCKDPDPLKFEKITERELTHGDGQLQNEDISVNGAEAQHLRVIIESAYDHFISIHRINVHGNAVRG